MIRNVIAEKISQLKGNSLKAKSIRSMVTLSIGMAAERVLKFGRYMILARILAVDQFGLMAMVIAAGVLFEALTEVGVKQSVIQNKRGAEPDYLNVAWWFQMIRGLGLFAMAYLAAPWISSFYDMPELLRLLRVAFLAIFFRALISPRVYVLEREYRFGKAVFLVQGSGILGSIVTVILAFLIRNVWSLVIGFVAEYAILCVLSYVFMPVKPTFKINRDDLRELLRFARGMFGLHILTLIVMQTDVVMLGKLVPAIQLGMYSLALRLSEQPAWLFSQVLGRVLLPAYAESQGDNEILRRRVVKTIRLTFMVGAPLTALLVIGAKPLLFLVYGRTYMSVAVPFAILSVSVFVRIQAHVLTTIFLAIGKPHLHRGVAILRAVLIICLMYPAITAFGLKGAAGAVLVSNTVGLCMQLIWVRRAIGLRLRDYVLARTWNADVPVEIGR